MYAICCTIVYMNELDPKSLEDLRSRARAGENVLRSAEFRALFDVIKTLPAEQKAAYGEAVNKLRQELVQLSRSAEPASQDSDKGPLDVTAPISTNQSAPQLLNTENGSQHPITTELERASEIFELMGFEIVESRQIDDDYHMFETLNFPADHPARDDYDTFMTEDGLIAPAHTSTMQNRVIKERLKNLENGEPIAVMVAGRVFRNEDLDARHEHTFHQIEGVYVGKNVTVGNLIATLKTFLESYYEQELKTRITPFYFPFTEPSFEFSLSCPFCKGEGCHICSQEGWIELLGCGMIHPNVLKEAGVDPEVYTGFAWGMGVERLVMMKYDIDDIRHFNSGKLAFLRQFK